MRLFVAVNFSDKIKKDLQKLQDKIRKHTVCGNFSSPDNLHLTIVFLGEIPPVKLDTLKEALDKTAFRPIELAITGIGSFRRSGGDIFWAGIKSGEPLLTLHKRLSSELKAAGFTVEERDFKPHLTLAREVVTDSKFDIHAIEKGFSALSFKISSIELMKSERISGELIYTPIHTVEAK